MIFTESMCLSHGASYTRMTSATFVRLNSTHWDLVYLRFCINGVLGLTFFRPLAAFEALSVFLFLRC